MSSPGAGRARRNDPPLAFVRRAGRGGEIAIEPLGSSVEYGWTAEFAASVTDTNLHDRLEVALDGRGAFRRFKNTLVRAPAERERWFAFRDARLREAAREWLAEQWIEPTVDPPALR